MKHKLFAPKNTHLLNCYCLTTLLFSSLLFLLLLPADQHRTFSGVTLCGATPGPVPAPNSAPSSGQGGPGPPSLPAGVIIGPNGQPLQIASAPSGSSFQVGNQQILTIPNGNSSNFGLTGAIATATSSSNNGNPQTGAASNPTAFVLQFLHHDLKNGVAFVNMMPMNHTNRHEPRIELRYQSRHPYVSIDERTPNNTVVSAIVVNDDDNDSTNLSIEQGNELGHFALVSTPYTNTIQVSGAPLSSAQVPQYNLTIVARDTGVPPKMSSVNLVIKVTATSQPRSLPNEQNKPPVADLMNVAAGLVVFFSILVFLIILGCALCQRPTSKKGGPTSGGNPSAGGVAPPPRAVHQAGSDSRMHHSSDPFIGLDLSHTYRHPPPPNHHYMPK